MRPQFLLKLRRRGMRNLRPLSIADARVDVVRARGEEREQRRFCVEDEPLADAAPVREVASDPHRRQFALRGPRVELVAAMERLSR